ncbi:type VI secretion system protein TssA [Sphingomonas sp. 1P06PA]|uniref:type VI secretion system protein TssA n=1 Tax=Sphingomonas sp. 1P06PA TaxID=554121 RepID=UPI0039A448B5
MAVEVADLLAPVSDENPVGEDLSYDAERQQIEMAFESSISDDSGESDVNWRDVIALIEQQSARTKDIWLPVYLARAGARARRIETVATAAQYLGGLLESYWPTLHPQLDEYGFQGRKGPCEGLTRLGEFILPLRRIPLLRHPRLGEFSGADFERFRDNAEAEDGYGLFRAALEDAGTNALIEAIAQLDAIKDGIQRADRVLVAEADGDTGANFRATYDALDSMRRAIAQFAGGSAEPGATDEPADGALAAATAPSQGGPSGPGFVAGRIDSREDVLTALDAITEYYRRREPGSPVPLALRRARDWVNADFLSVLEDIAPGGMDEVRRVLVSQKGEAQSSW